MRQRLQVLVLMVLAVLALHAQEQEVELLDSLSPVGVRIDSLAPAAAAASDSLYGPPVYIPAEGDIPSVLLTKKERKQLSPKTPRTRFVPQPQRALWLALLFPGAGQIYNRKYWKLPIVYGGFLGCVYAFTWNQQMYMDYSQAYLDIMDDDPATNSYEQMLPYRYDVQNNVSRLQKLFKRKKDYYRRYRDLSAFCFAGVYLLSVIDAYVDAQLSEFNISKDLSMRVSPAVIENSTLNKTQSYGMGCQFRF